MEVNIYLGDEKVRLKANALTAHHYKNQFKADILADTFKALGGVETVMHLHEVKDREDAKKLGVLLDSIDSVLIHQFVWAFAKTANIHIDPFYEWIANVDMPPVTELILQDGFTDLLIGNVYRKK